MFFLPPYLLEAEDISIEADELGTEDRNAFFQGWNSISTVVQVENVEGSYAELGGHEVSPKQRIEVSGIYIYGQSSVSISLALIDLYKIVVVFPMHKPQSSGGAQAAPRSTPRPKRCGQGIGWPSSFQGAEGCGLSLWSRVGMAGRPHLSGWG